MLITPSPTIRGFNYGRFQYMDRCWSRLKCYTVPEFILKQHVTEPTCRGSHTLDMFISCEVENVLSDVNVWPGLLDHLVIPCSLSLFRTCSQWTGATFKRVVLLDKLAPKKISVVVIKPKSPWLAVGIHKARCLQPSTWMTMKSYWMHFLSHTIKPTNTSSITSWSCGMLLK